MKICVSWVMIHDIVLFQDSVYLKTFFFFFLIIYRLIKEKWIIDIMNIYVNFHTKYKSKIQMSKIL